jgi:hypothetical protein
MKRKTSIQKKKSPYRVFVSHASADGWVARQIAKEIRALGGRTFVDAENIEHGDAFAKAIIEGLDTCSEFVVLLTRSSISRSWVHQEIGAAFYARLKVVGVLYGVSSADFSDMGGMGMLAETNCVDINDMDDYIRNLRKRVVAQ